MSSIARASTAPGGLRKESAWRRRDRRWAYVFIGPQLIGVGVFILVPFLMGVVLALVKWDGLTPPVWVGLDNFVREFTDPLLGRAIVNNLVLAAITVPVGLGLAVVVAVALEKLRTRTLYLVMFFAPVVTSTIAVSMIWQQLLRPDGVISSALADVFHIPPPDWLGDPSLALIAVAIVSIWGSLGLNVVIFLSGLQNISPAVIEAAKIDGAGPLRTFWRIQLPLLSPVMFFSTVIAFISSLQAFDVIFILTKNAGPDNATRTVVYHIFDLGFRRSEFGVASAASVILLIITLAITLVQFGLQKRFVHYEGSGA